MNNTKTCKGMSVHIHTHIHLSSSLKLTSWFVAIHFSKLTKAFLLIQKESCLFSWNVAFLYTHGRKFLFTFFVYRTIYTYFTIYNTEPHKNTINQGALNISEVSWKGSHSHQLGGTDGSGDGAGTFPVWLPFGFAFWQAENCICFSFPFMLPQPQMHWRNPDS